MVARRNALVWRKQLWAAMMMNFGEPLLYLLGMGYGLGYFVREMSGMGYLTFLASGVAALSVMTSATFEGMYSAYSRMVPQRTYEAILATPLSVDDIAAGEMLWSGCKAMISGASILLVAALLGAVGGWQALWTLPLMVLVGLAFTGPALMVTALARDWQTFQYYMTLAVTPMMMLCGVFYPLDAFPPALQSFAQALPLTHAVDLLRPLVAGRPADGLWEHVLYLLLFTLTSGAGAVLLLRRRMLG